MSAPSVAVGGRRRPSLRPGKILVYVIMFAITALWVIPTLGLLVSSFRPADDVRSSGWWTVVTNPSEARFTTDNYRILLGMPREGETAPSTQYNIDLGRAVINTIIIALPATIIPILIAAFAAYGFAWISFPGRRVLFIIVVALLVVPLQISLVPILRDYVRLELGGTYLGVWLAHTGFGLPLAVYLLYNYISTIPRDIFESAFLDGATHFTIFTRLILPLSMPALASFAIFQFLWTWNDLLVALVFLGAQPQVQVLTQRLLGLMGQYGQDWHLLTAGAFISMLLPLVVFFSLQRFFVFFRFASFFFARRGFWLVKGVFGGGGAGPRGPRPAIASRSIRTGGGRSRGVSTLKWWQRAVFYQIYPRSFADSNGDGIGDFPGITARLDHLRDLGVDAIWLSPHFPSPFLDCGYDISDYTGVAPEYGTLADFEAFLHAAHERGIRVILDLVLNHSSDQHPWFQESRAGRDSPKRDWYIWRDPAPDGGPPNNWASIFGGSAWAYDEASGQYYYHIFLPEQPDLNWRNPAVKAAMWDAVRFWLDLGVDGFRLDAIATIFEHPDLPDHTLPVSPGAVLDANMLAWDDYWRLLHFQLHQPGMHELMKELRALVDSYPGDRVLVGEDEDLAFHGSGDDELHLVFNFPLQRARRITPAHVRANQAQRLAALPPGAWPCNTLGNHDASRVWSRYGDGQHHDALARLHLALLLTLKGTPFLYYGEEIGMADLQLSALGELRDTNAINQYHVLRRRGVAPEEALREVLASTRDRCRSPMQWSDAPSAGFCDAGATPWLPLHPGHRGGVSVAAQADDPASLLSFYRRLLALRRATPALVAGDFAVLHPDDEACLAFLRHDAGSGQRCLVVLNFSPEAQQLPLGPGLGSVALRFSSEAHVAANLTQNQVRLAPFEILILDVDELH